MTAINKQTVRCRCEQEVDFVYFDSVNARINPDLKKKVLNREVNMFTCTNCGYRQELATHFLYNDVENDIFVYVVPESDRQQKEAIIGILKEARSKILSWSKKLDSPIPDVVFGYDELLEFIRNHEIEGRQK